MKVGVWAGHRPGRQIPAPRTCSVDRKCVHRMDSWQDFVRYPSRSSPASSPDLGTKVQGQTGLHRLPDPLQSKYQMMPVGTEFYLGVSALGANWTHQEQLDNLVFPQAVCRSWFRWRCRIPVIGRVYEHLKSIRCPGQFKAGDLPRMSGPAIPQPIDHHLHSTLRPDANMMLNYPRETLEY